MSDALYPPIEDHGLVGNMRTAALVGTNGCVDWLCWPHFDSPSVFGAILDAEKGGHCRIEIEGAVRQAYLPDTNVLVTRVTCETGAADILDYMPVGDVGPEGGYHRLIRHVRVLRGRVPVRVTCRPGFDYGREGHTVDLLPEGALFTSESGRRLLLSTVRTLAVDASDARRPGVEREIELVRGDRLTLELRHLDAEGTVEPPLSREAQNALLRETTRFWRA